MAVRGDPLAQRSDIHSTTFATILSSCERLSTLNFSRSPTLVYSQSVSSTNFTSSTLTHLQINLGTFCSCLYLLDGRLPCLTTLTIRVRRISPSSENIDRVVRALPSAIGRFLEPCFSFPETTTDVEVFHVDLRQVYKGI